MAYRIRQSINYNLNIVSMSRIIIDAVILLNPLTDCAISAASKSYSTSFDI